MDILIRESKLKQKDRLLKQRSVEWGALVGILIVSIMILMAIFASFIAPYDPAEMSLVNRLKPPGYTDADGNQFLLGTDSMGRDLLSRIIFGARVSLFVGIVSVFTTSIFGTVLGLLAGYFGGIVETLIMRLVDMMMSMPSMLMALALLSVIGNGIQNIILAILLTYWSLYARVQYGQVKSFAKREFIQAAHTMGASDNRILFRHILPNILSTSIVLMTLDLGNAIIFESSMSYLGLGVPITIPTWGSMLSDGRAYMSSAWWVSTFPGIAIMCTVLGFNLLGDWVRDKLDPTLKL
jgi:peptide/nickel transport system permease protein